MVLAALILSLVLPGASRGQADNMVLLPAKDDPTVSFRFLFRVGSQDDPAGKEGLAALTASILAQGATQKHTYEQVLSALYPMAASIDAQVDKEMTAVSGRAHIDNLDAYYALFMEVLLEPAFDESDFQRVRSDMLNYVRTSLRYSQDEELGKEALYASIFAGTPYEHLEEGTVQSLEAITLDDVQSFYRTHYTRGRLVVGLGGGYPESLVKRVRTDLERFPAGDGAAVAAPTPTPIEGMNVEIIEKDAPATAISFGFPIGVTRGDKDFYALAFATAWLGEHRNSFSHLYEVIREKRGLNYGDYAYVEHFPGGHRAQFPPTNVARRQQIFQVWIRPVPHEARVFAFRAALRELRDLVENGMTQEEFDLTRKFLQGYILHYAPTTMDKLGYALDDRFYGVADGHWRTYQRMLDEVTLTDVNAALAKHLTFENMWAVFVTTDAAGLKGALVGNAPSPITYESEKPDAVLAEDVEISTYPLSIAESNVRIVKIEEVFER